MGMVNAGLEKHKNMQRENTLKRISEAIDQLRKKGLRLTKKAVAEEAGLAINTLKSDYVRTFLRSVPEFNSDLGVGVPPQIAALNSEHNKAITLLKDQLNKERNRRKLVEAENIKLKSKYRELNLDYQRLLGEYQTKVGKKLTRI